MHKTSLDKSFNVSALSLRKLYVEADAAGCAVAFLFRQKAANLARSKEPTFGPNRGVANRKFITGLSPGTYLSLKVKAERMGVSMDDIGELICTFEDTKQ